MEALLNWLLGIWEELVPWEIIAPWDEGIRVRFGKYIKVLKPGMHLSLPWIDEIQTINVKLQAVNIPNQNVWTLQRESVTVSGAVEYRITDIKKCFVDVQDHDESLIEVTQGLIAEYVGSVMTEELSVESIMENVIGPLSVEGERWGVEVTRLYISDLVKTIPLRIFGE